MKYYEERRRKRKKKKTFLCFGITLSFVVLIFSYVFFVVNPVVLEATRHAVYSLSTSAVSDAVYDVLSKENITYNDLVDVEYLEDNIISYISLDTVKLNLIARKFYQVAQVYLDNMGKLGVDVPLGAFTGLPFLSGVGPKINLKLVSVGAMTSTFESSFRSAGINQTNHTINIQLYASVSMMLPAYTATIDSVTEMLVAESVIIGKVPQVYLSGNSALNFTPN